MKAAIFATLAGAALAASAATAQDSYRWPAPTAQDEAAPRLSLPIGTPVRLETRTRLSTKDYRTGQRIALRVAETVSYQGQVLIPAGSPAFGEISWSEKNGHFGKRGSLGINLLYIETPYGPVQISGDAARDGHSGTALSVATIALVSPWGFLIHGTSAAMAPGTPVTAYLAEAMPFTVAAPNRSAAIAVPDGGGSVALR